MSSQKPLSTEDSIALVQRLYAQRLQQVLSHKELRLLDQYEEAVARQGAEAPRSVALLAVNDKVQADPQAHALEERLNALLDQQTRDQLASRFVHILTPREVNEWHAYVTTARQQGAAAPQSPEIRAIAKKIDTDPVAGPLVQRLLEQQQRREGQQ